MQEIKAKRTEETWNEQAFNPGINLIVECEGEEYALATQLGTSESYTLLYDDKCFFVVSRNDLLPSVAISHFDIRHHLHVSEDHSYPVSPDPEWAVYLQDWEVDDRLGENWEQMSDAEIVDKLLGWHV